MLKEDNETELEPRLAKALKLLTLRLMTAINNKLYPLTKTILSQHEVNNHLDGAKARLLQLEDTSNGRDASPGKEDRD